MVLCYMKHLDKFSFKTFRTFSATKSVLSVIITIFLVDNSYFFLTFSIRVMKTCCTATMRIKDKKRTDLSKLQLCWTQNTWTWLRCFSLNHCNACNFLNKSFLSANKLLRWGSNFIDTLWPSIMMSRGGSCTGSSCLTPTNLNTLSPCFRIWSTSNVF